MAKLKIFKVNPAINLPKHQTDGSACFDIAFQGYGKNEIKGYSSKNKPVSRLYNGALTISPGDRMLVPTGYIMDIPKGYSVRLHARSGTSLKQGLVLANAEGVIDSDYVEEVFVILHNVSENAVTINNGDRVAQGELVKNEELSIEQTFDRPGIKTTRMGGMGSTGVSTSHPATAATIVINIPDTKTIKNSEKRGRGRPKGSVKKA